MGVRSNNNGVSKDEEKTIKIGKKISLEMKPPNVYSLCCKRSYRRILKLNFYDVDTITTLKYIKCVKVTEKDYCQIDLIIKFCEVTFLPIKLYASYPVPEKLKKKFERHNIKYKIIDNAT